MRQMVPLTTWAYNKHSFPYGIDGGLVSKVDGVWFGESSVGDEVIKDGGHMVGTARVYKPGVLSWDCR